MEQSWRGSMVENSEKSNDDVQGEYELPASQKNCVVIINTKAGTSSDWDPENLRASVAEKLSEGFSRVHTVCVEPEDFTSALENAIEEAPDAIIVGGGDGSVRSAAGLLVDTDIALGVLPLGTLNRLARDLRMPLEVDEAAAVLAAAPIEAMDTAELNGEIFLCNSLIGLPLQVADRRRKLRGQTLLNRLSGYWSLLVDVLSTTQKITLELDDHREPKKVRAISIAVSNNRYEETPSLMMQKCSLQGGELAVYVARHDTGASLMLSVVRAMLGLWRNDPDVDEFRTKSMTIKPKGKKIRVSNDGEVEVVSGPLEYRVREKNLRVLLPTEQQARQGL